MKSDSILLVQRLLGESLGEEARNFASEEPAKLGIAIFLLIVVCCTCGFLVYDHRRSTEETTKATEIPCSTELDTTSMTV